MRVTINLAKGSGPRELVEVLSAADAVEPARHSVVDPLDILTVVVQGAFTMVLKGLERTVHRGVCRLVTFQRGAELNVRRQRLQRKLLAWLRITPGRVSVKP